MPRFVAKTLIKKVFDLSVLKNQESPYQNDFCLRRKIHFEKLSCLFSKFALKLQKSKHYNIGVKIVI